MAKQKQCKIETGPQCRKILGKIRAKTQWTVRRMAAEAGLNPETMRKVVNGVTLNPGLAIRQQISKLADRVEAMQ